MWGACWLGRRQRRGDCTDGSLPRPQGGGAKKGIKVIQLLIDQFFIGDEREKPGLPILAVKSEQSGALGFFLARFVFQTDQLKRSSSKFFLLQNLIHCGLVVIAVP